ncbi:S16 family serine protease [Cytobacillus sp. IB215665]|uniref:S16 family serine protease n=1 Tax=Cytobacillus sp. IB215665 TaxID=3097357 RepID=UPI002A0BD1DB|nr:S16 family serine protease [Cytobacillus sp. IB215665]MDX8366645.1 S16 family serine protease [Cytobacillus sp. IB215665]
MIEFFEALPLFLYLFGAYLLLSGIKSIFEERTYKKFNIITRILLGYLVLYWSFSSPFYYYIYTEGHATSLESKISEEYRMKDSHFSKLTIFTYPGVKQKDLTIIKQITKETNTDINIILPLTKSIVSSSIDKSKESKLNGYKEGMIFASSFLKREIPEDMIIITDGETGGSDGMIMTLELIHQLGDKDLIKGRKIAGTGTVNSKGEVGSIDGLEIKIEAAEKSGYDFCIIPKSLENKGKNIVEENYYNIQLIPVETIEEAYNYLTSK